MDLVMVVAGTLAFPGVLLLFLLWMARFEESLPAAVRRAERRPDPPPVLAIPTQRIATAPAPRSDRQPDRQPDRRPATGEQSLSA